MARLGPADYKRRAIGMWDEVAPRYHRRWASTDAGPFRSTARLVGLAGVRRGDRVLDLACGTGMVAGRAAAAAGRRGLVVGVDMSGGALRIARRSAGGPGGPELVRADAEAPPLAGPFDVVTCQYALFFFPDAARALRGARRLLRGGGTLAVSVHGRNVPFYTCILDAVTEFIPDYTPKGVPRLDRFGDPRALRAAAERAGFAGARVRRFTFSYSPGTFADYWRDYLRYLARPLKEKVRALPAGRRAELRRAVGRNAAPYAGRGGRLRFPWEVLIMTARRPVTRGRARA